MNAFRVRRMGMRAAIAPLAVLATLISCAERDRARMVSAPPPPGWQEGLMRQRAVKDDYFRHDPEAPLLAEDREDFEALVYWDPDPDYYFIGPINFYEQPERFEIVATSGRLRPCERVGWIGFVLGGATQVLQVYRLLDVESTSEAAGFFLPFMDATTGKETYPAGRYVELHGRDGGPYVLDFNRAYNPSCAYGDPQRFACPVTPPENRLRVPVEAGERGYRERGATT